MRLTRTTTVRCMAVLTLLATAAACVTTQGQGERSGREVITRADVEPHLGSVQNAYQLVERLRPQWLRTRSHRIPSSEQQELMEGDVVVYLDGTRAGGPAALREVDAETVREIRYLNAARAARLGTGHQHGAIMVRTR